ncbi:LPXTG cell wall anchor domain-containing protein [endosymbiont 'TC1' of Trimyema compressum]|nr:LPXTG cell wall anchor domain-containing protein [endosymbiont 'TC1' of Trimyema compressum]
MGKIKHKVLKKKVANELPKTGNNNIVLFSLGILIVGVVLFKLTGIKKEK